MQQFREYPQQQSVDATTNRKGKLSEARWRKGLQGPSSFSVQPYDELHRGGHVEVVAIKSQFESSHFQKYC